MNRLMPCRMRYSEVDSSGSRNPDDRPMATQFFSQNFWRWPVAKRMRRGEPMTGPSRPSISDAVASSSLMNSLQ